MMTTVLGRPTCDNLTGQSHLEDVLVKQLEFDDEGRRRRRAAVAAAVAAAVVTFNSKDSHATQFLDCLPHTIVPFGGILQVGSSAEGCIGTLFNLLDGLRSVVDPVVGIVIITSVTTIVNSSTAAVTATSSAAAPPQLVDGPPVGGNVGVDDGAVGADPPQFGLQFGPTLNQTGETILLGGHCLVVDIACAAGHGVVVVVVVTLGKLLIAALIALHLGDGPGQLLPPLDQSVVPSPNHVEPLVGGAGNVRQLGLGPSLSLDEVGLGLGRHDGRGERKGRPIER
mmetsp:Transcript_37467/g.76260  ORF Transcript_37467/g.76260 Transcript_37467/m.76260 type:complete len:283 (+) Transcript_37467:1227-2075(+)